MRDIEDICRALRRYVDEYKWGWGIARRQLKFRFGVDLTITELQRLYKQPLQQSKEIRL